MLSRVHRADEACFSFRPQDSVRFWYCRNPQDYLERYVSCSFRQAWLKSCKRSIEWFMAIFRISAKLLSGSEVVSPRAVLTKNQIRRVVVVNRAHGGAKIGPLQKDATGMLPSRPNFCNSLVQALRAPWLRSLKQLSGRSQRGDSAWCKTLDHLLSLLMEAAIYAANRALLRGRNRRMNC